MKLKDYLVRVYDYVDNSKLRHWIDGEDSGKGLEEIYDSKPRSNEIEEFLAKIARTIANLMKMKKFVIATGKVYLPDRYLVFLSPQKDKEIQGRMREMFIEGLQYLSEESASELVGKTSINKIPIKVELRVDGTMADSSTDYRVQIVDSKTGRSEIFESESNTEDDETIIQLEDDKTVVEPSELTVIDNEKTVVETNPFYYLEVSPDDAFSKPIPVTKQVIKIGRPSKTSKLDIELPNDKISRHHATLSIDGTGNIWLTHYGQNPTKINGIDCNFEEKRLVKPNQKIQIENFILYIRK